MEFFSQNLTYLRKRAGLTQLQVAEKLHIKLTRWNNWEKGNSNPHLEEFTEISKLFEVNEHDLLHSNLVEDVQLNQKRGLQEKTAKSTAKSTANSTANAQNEAKTPLLNDQPGQYATNPNTLEYWRDKYIALLEQKVSVKPTDYVAKETFAILETRVFALQEFVLKHASRTPNTSLQDLMAELSNTENELRKSNKTYSLSDGNS